MTRRMRAGPPSLSGGPLGTGALDLGHRATLPGSGAYRA